jgi:hypothetical protein
MATAMSGWRTTVNQAARRSATRRACGPAQHTGDSARSSAIATAAEYSDHSEDSGGTRLRLPRRMSSPSSRLWAPDVLDRVDRLIDHAHAGRALEPETNHPPRVRADAPQMIRQPQSSGPSGPSGSSGPDARRSAVSRVRHCRLDSQTSRCLKPRRPTLYRLQASAERFVDTTRARCPAMVGPKTQMGGERGP